MSPNEMYLNSFIVLIKSFVTIIRNAPLIEMDLNMKEYGIKTK